MKRAVMIRSLIIALVAMLISGAVSSFVIRRQYVESRQKEMREMLNVISSANFGKDYYTLAKNMAGLSENSLRVTFIAGDGSVMGDSAADPKKMGNHKSRPEVADALKTGYGEDVRRSQTTGTDMLYAAKKMPDGSICRLSQNLGAVYLRVWSLLPGLLIGFVTAVAVTPFLAWRLSKRVEKPFSEVALSLENINAGGYGTDLPEPEYAELVPIVRQINTLSHKIVSTLSELTEERNRITYLLDNMNEGLVVLDHEQKILIANRSARSFFGTQKNPEGGNLLKLINTPRIVESAAKVADSNESESFDSVSYDGSKILHLFVNPVAGDRNGGVIILITDVTATRKAEQIRSEFIANASHELKTPLTSIKGFAELMESGIITDTQKTSQYLSLIRSETDRMIVIINDILDLSELESIEEDAGQTDVSMLDIAKKAAATLSVQAAKKDVSVTVSGDGGTVRANPSRMAQLAVNLMDNAIKYNRDGGKVIVAVKKHNGTVTFTVADTGEGIPPESLDRVFERFYRVDKSRSRKMSGTGLGLSIVKHIVELYKGKINLKSKIGKGTVIKVTLPSGGGQVLE